MYLYFITLKISKKFKDTKILTGKNFNKGSYFKTEKKGEIVERQFSFSKPFLIFSFIAKQLIIF